MAHSDHSKDDLLDRCLYVGLFSAAPSDAGGGTELTGAGYARQAVTWTLSGDTGTNSAAITFENTGADWDEVGWAGLFDASSGGNMELWTALDAFTLRAGRTYTIPAASLEVDFE